MGIGEYAFIEDFKMEEDELKGEALMKGLDAEETARPQVRLY